MNIYYFSISPPPPLSSISPLRRLLSFFHILFPFVRSHPVFSAMRSLGVNNGDHIVIYDASNSGLFSAARLWWMLRVFGHNSVSVLDGGLERWLKEGASVESGAVEVTVSSVTLMLQSQEHPISWLYRCLYILTHACTGNQSLLLNEASISPPFFQPGDFVAPQFRRELVRYKHEILANLHSKKEQLVDARPEGRFKGTVPEPKPGLRGGRIPGARNVPFSTMLHPMHKVWCREGGRSGKRAGGGGIKREKEKEKEKKKR